VEQLDEEATDVESGVWGLNSLLRHKKKTMRNVNNIFDFAIEAAEADFSHGRSSIVQI
jgi:hypothetical protein